MNRQHSSLSIRDWAVEDKPREKLICQGCAALTDAELLAILIGSGSREHTALSLAKLILAAADHSLIRLGKFTVEQLCQFKGIGEAKAVTISAALEIARRSIREPREAQMKISDSSCAYHALAPKLAHLEHEEFRILYLNNANKVIQQTLISRGGITGTLVDVRLVLRKALELGAVGLILAHNHPSGNLVPSEADKEITRKIQLGAKVMDIKVLDHLIVAQQGYFSFADQNLLL
ncbi:MAG: DNA repair protein RadC [Eudoraea sp.]|nr:DNA repair protein RadC [Eudoraea sp.]